MAMYTWHEGHWDTAFRKLNMTGAIDIDDGDDDDDHNDDVF